MATTERDIYETTFDEDVQSTTNQCPECDGRVTTNAAETVCDDRGLSTAIGRGVDAMGTTLSR